MKGRGNLFVALIIRVRSFKWGRKEGKMFINVAYITWCIGNIKNCIITIICPVITLEY
jgi:hypothetical protein